MNRKMLLAAVAGIGMAGAPAFAQTPAGTAFSFQGRLDTGGTPATGPYDLAFRLFDAATVGGQVGGVVFVNDLAVTDGLFTTLLDFGSVAFAPDARWLEIGVRDGASIGAYTALAPRQQITAAPMALYALNSEWVKTGNDIHNTNTGNVGVNESSPLTNLHVQGTGDLGFLDAGDLGTDQIVIEGGQAWLGLYSDEVGAPGSGISLGEINSTTGALTKWSLVQRTSGSGGDFSLTYGSDPAGNANARFFQVKPTGEFCIGVDNPSAKLHVKAVGSTQGIPPTGLRVASEFPSGTSGTSTEFIQFDGNEISAVKDNVFSTLEFQKDGGQVNIGNLLVDTPKLTVSRNFQFVSNADLQFEDVLIHDTGNAWLGLYSDNVGNVGSGITFAEYGVTRYKWGMYARTTDNVGDFVITFGTDVNPTANEKMFQVDRDGTTKVKVLEILGADVAERFPCSDAVEPGTVVMIDAANAGSLCVARGAYNRKVAGVISGAGDLPVGAILGNLPGKEKAPPVALSGRVWVKCDASEHAIEPGDLITTSETPGHAMKAADPGRSPGATIGKAMSALAQGETGLVLVLVNLQ